MVCIWLKNDWCGLERFAVWQPLQVEEKLSDYFAGRKNRHLEQMNLDNSKTEHFPNRKQKIAV
ncbi:MAG: hypothetical protein KBA66_08005 [Leptospiraceae bacterium]|nr:hypothetical protein [Leptospiraceae bacterium]